MELSTKERGNFQKQIDETKSTLNALSEEVADGVKLPETPATGTHTLKSVDGELTWVEDVE